MGQEIIAKNYADTYLYSKGNYEKHIFEFIMKGEQVNKLDSSFDDVRYQVKNRQITSVLVKILDSKNVILLTGNEPLPRAFKVFAATDIKGDKKLKAFIDVSEILKKENGKYNITANGIDVLISYLISAMNHVIYYSDPKRILMSNALIASTTECFADLFTYILDYLRISGLSVIRDKCIYLSALYAQKNLFNKDTTDQVRDRALKISGLSDREAQIVDIQLEESTFINIKFFIESLSKILKLDKLTLESFLDKWVFLYGTGTQFSLELYPAFATMLTNAYAGAYLNNQKTIEKVTGKNLVDFSKTLFQIGSDAVG